MKKSVRLLKFNQVNMNNFSRSMVIFVKKHIQYMKILLSPAKSIDVTNSIAVPFTTIPTFTRESEILVSKLKKISSKKLGTLMHISQDLAELNYQRFQNWEKPFEQTAEIIPSILAFNGEVYKGFNARTLSEEEWMVSQDKIRILSGLYGVLKPLDLLVPYRLEMGTKWQITPKQKNLYEFWGTKISKYLNGEMEKNEVLINLASSEYFKAVDKKTLSSRVITPIFKEFKNGEYKVVMMYAKHARGSMARYIVSNKIEDPEYIKMYTRDGYQFDVNQSNENEWVFIR